MKRLFLALFLASTLLTGCGSREDGPSAQPEQPPQQETPADQESPLPEVQMILSSGAGGWATVLDLSPDGSFTGNYHDSEMGSTGEDFPNGTCYVSTFSGQLGQPHPGDDGSQVLPLESLTTEQTSGESWIEDGVCYIPTEPFGLENTQELRLFAPETSVAGLPEELLNWWPGRWEETRPETLGSWCLWNEAEQLAFFSYPEA